METNFEELLTNTNLSMINILLYYQEEIANELEYYENLFNVYAYSKDDYDKYINETKIKEEEIKFVNLIKEFTGLVSYIIDKYYKGHYLPLKIHELKYKLAREVEHNSDNIPWLIGYLNEYVKIIIEGLWDNIFLLYSDEEQQNMNILRQERKDIETFYIAELNRLLDEKEARIYELEKEQAKNEQEIDGLINENVCLRRIIALNSGEDEDGTYRY